MRDLGCPIPGLSWNLDTKGIGGAFRTHPTGPAGALHFGPGSIRATQPKSRRDLTVRGENELPARVELGTLVFNRSGVSLLIWHAMSPDQKCFCFGSDPPPLLQNVLLFFWSKRSM